MNILNLLILILSGLLILGFIFIGVVTYIARATDRKNSLKSQDFVETVTCVAHAGSENGCEDVKSKVVLKALNLMEFKNRDGRILYPENFDLYLVKGECMRYVDIHPNDLIFSSKGFDVECYRGALPIILILRKRVSSPDTCAFKLRRLWRVCNYRDNLEGILISILESPEFQEVRQRPTYDGDDALIKDFFENRLKKFEQDYINCEFPNVNDEKIIISTTFHTDIERVRFSIHPVSNVIGKVEAAFPIEEKYINEV